MSEETSPGTPQGSSAKPQELSAGAIMRAAREASGLHVAALAVAMKVPVKKLEALEADRWDLLPDAVFVRALASSVCRSLKIDPAPVLSKLPQLATPRLDAEERGINTPFNPPTQGSERTLLAFVQRPVVLLVAVLLLIAMGILFFPIVHDTVVVTLPTAEPVAATQVPLGIDPQRESVSTAVAETVNSVASAVPPVTAATVAPVVPAAPVSPAATKATATAPVSQATTSAPTTATSPVTSPAKNVAASAAASAATPVANPNPVTSSSVLVIRVKETTWVEILDAKKVVLLRRTLLRGETLGFGGDLPLSVIVGRADGVQVEVRGKPLSLESDPTNNVARFEVK